MRPFSLAFLVAAILALATAPTLAQRKAAERPPAEGVGKAEVNAWTIGLAGGLLEGSFIRYAADIAKVLDDGDNLRVIPMVTYGAVGNVTDLLYLRGVDVAITQSDVLEHFRTETPIPSIERRINYIAPLFHAEVHVCAKPEYRALRDLAGKKVAFNTRGSAANLTGQIVFKKLNIPVEPVFINNAVALEQMKGSDLAAVVHVVAAPNDLFAAFKGEAPCRFLPVDYAQPFRDLYVPATLEARSYPAFIEADKSVATIAVPTVLAVFNWPKDSERTRRVTRFIEAFYTKFDQLQRAPYQPKWKEINIAGEVPGWTRYAAATAILQKLSASDDQTLRARFESFLSRRGARGQLSEQERNALFKEFMNWQNR